MHDHDRRAFLARAETPEFRVRLKRAEGLIWAALADGVPPGAKSYVAFSGGKDSTVLLDLVLAQAPRIAVMTYDFGEKMPRPYWQETLRNGNQMIRDRDGGSEKAPRIRILRRNYGMRTDLFHSHFPRLYAEGYRLSFVGLRRSESLRRRRRIDAGAFLYPRIAESWPLADWSADDVWARIVSRGLPYHSHYDRYSRMEDIRNVRFSTFFDAHFAHIGAPNVDAYNSWRYAYKG